MSGAMMRLRPRSWTAGALSPADKDRVLREARSRIDEVQAMGRAYRRTGYIVFATGCGIGLAGMVAAATLFPLKTVENHYFTVDHTTGVVAESLGAKDAPEMFGEQTAQQYLRAYIENRESYVAETADLLFHRAAIMSSPVEQQIYAKWFSPRSNPQSPQAVYGNRATIRVDNFRFTKYPGEGKGKTLVYQVRFDRIEVVGGVPGVPKHWLATVQFQWHPELTMSREDRTINPAGMQVLSYGSQSEEKS